MHARPTLTGAGKTLGALVLTAALASTTACGSDGSSSQSGGDSSQGSGSTSSPAAQHDDTDVAFASDMLVHHAQALDMVEMTEGRLLDPEVTKLAEQIKAAQAPEIDTFTTWLEQWGEKVPDTSGEHRTSDMDSMGSGDGSGMAGMMSESDMTELDQAPGSQFQDRWLTMMIEHHRGAVEMARTEVADGKYGPATKLARQIATSQTAEIDTMEKLLS